MRSGGKREGGEVRSFKSHSCPLHCRSVVLLREWTLKINSTHYYIQSELTVTEWQYAQNFPSECRQRIRIIP